MNSCRTLLTMAVLCAASVSLAGEAGKPVPPAYQPPSAPAPGDWPKARLVGFMRELTDFVYKHHVVTEPDRKTYGMTYEFYKDGKRIQEFGLDAMHDGSWFMAAMATAERVDPEGDYLERAQRYQVPFYVNMLRNSDRLFPQMKPTNEDKKPFAAPIKGWIPRGWDEGIGYQKNRNQRFEESYFTSSNHLMQDVADGLLNVWMSTRDPAVAEGAALIQGYKKEYFGAIPVIEYAAGVTNNQPELYRKHRFAAFTPQALNPYYTGMYEQKGHSLPSYDDGLAWQYRKATAEYLLTGEFPAQFALTAAGRTYSVATGMEMYFGDRPYPYGMYFFDIQGPIAFAEGKLKGYTSTQKAIYGPRGLQISWVAAAILPYLSKHPQLWETYYREKHAAEPLVRIVDTPPITDGKRDEVYAKSQPVGGDEGKVTLLGDPKNLHILIESTLPQVEIRLQPASPVVGKAGAGRIVVTREGNVTAENAGSPAEKLLHTATFMTGSRWTAELRVPYTVVPGQAHWINGADHGRYSVAINGGTPRVVTMLSEPERVIRRLEALVLGSIATWHGVWKELGVIPSGYRSHNTPAPSWELSDAGNYAHLIHTIALWLAYREGKSEWEIIKARFPESPKPARPLPEGVRRAQGLS
jgi:hypothetical protein